MLGKTLVFLFRIAQFVEFSRFEKRRRKKGDQCLGLDRVLQYSTRRSGNCGNECSRDHILGFGLWERRFSAIRTTLWRTLFGKFMAEYYLALTHFSIIKVTKTIVSPSWVDDVPTSETRLAIMTAHGAWRTRHTTGSLAGGTRL